VLDAQLAEGQDAAAGIAALAKERHDPAA
jgi:hypothetical protein